MTHAQEENHPGTLQKMLVVPSVSKIWTEYKENGKGLIEKHTAKPTKISKCQDRKLKAKQNK